MANYLLDKNGKWNHPPESGRAVRQGLAVVKKRHRQAVVASTSKRGFAAGQVDHLTQSFLGSHLSINEECRQGLVRMQRRSRDLCMNNDYARKFLQMVKVNTIGPQGIRLQAQFMNDRGKPDLKDRELIEGHFNEWARARHCSIDGKLSWLQIQNLVIETIARDGEVLIQKIRRPGNKYWLKLRVMECDHLDVNHNERLANGNRIVMGVELDRDDRPVAYWLTDIHPGDYSLGGARITRRRVPARDILHLFVSDRPGQVRGVPWLHSAIRRLNMMGGYEEAELIGARIGASKMGFFTSPDGDGYTPAEAAADGQDHADYDLVTDAAPGTFEQLPDGVDFTAFDPQHPTSAFKDFMQAVLRGAASGLLVSYNTLANDLEGVNFSSIRSGVLEEREGWRVIQTWLAEILHWEIYTDWLELENTGGALSSLPADKLESKFQKIRWQPRGWSWVDPLKDTKANQEEYKLGTTTLTDIAAAKGRDLEDIFKQRRAELDLAATYGLTVGVVDNQLAIEELTDDETKNGN